MFPSAKETYTSKKRRRKENKAKSRKRKLERKTANCTKLLQNILCTAHPGNDDTCISSEQLDTAVIGKLNKKDARWLKILLSETKFTAEAVKLIKGVLREDVLPIVFEQLSSRTKSPHQIMMMEMKVLMNDL